MSGPITTFVFEYVWNDGENLRSKIKIMKFNTQFISIHNIPEWNYDGSSTGQSETGNSDLLIKPIYYCNNPFFTSTDYCKYYLVLCQVMNPDGSPHNTNNYIKLYKLLQSHFKLDNDFFDSWFGIEQEYLILDKNFGCYDEININKNYNYNEESNYNKNQHYCSVGTGKALGRQIAEEHMNMCIEAGIKICGINSEVTSSQWEFQIGPLNAFDVSNQLWMARYILIKVAEKYNAVISFHPKPFPQLNGSGAHTNFSTRNMRENGGLAKIYEVIDKLSKTHKEHIAVYGRYNELRLSGTNETAHIDTFSYGSCDRGSSIRIPLNVLRDGCGYLEDRRPAANMDPYLVTERILRTTFVD
jgi:glutamine synthetase